MTQAHKGHLGDTVGGKARGHFAWDVQCEQRQLQNYKCLGQKARQRTSAKPQTIQDLGDQLTAL